jgi:hypothetical protein
MRHRGNSIGGSNPSLSAIYFFKYLILLGISLAQQLRPSVHPTFLLQYVVEQYSTPLHIAQTDVGPRITRERWMSASASHQIAALFPKFAKACDSNRKLSLIGPTPLVAAAQASFQFVINAMLI